MSYLRKVWAIVRKDLLAEMRSREMISSMGAFSVPVSYTHLTLPTILLV